MIRTEKPRKKLLILTRYAASAPLQESRGRAPKAKDEETERITAE